MAINKLNSRVGFEKNIRRAGRRFRGIKFCKERGGGCVWRAAACVRRGTSASHCQSFKVCPSQPVVCIRFVVFIIYASCNCFLPTRLAASSSMVTFIFYLSSRSISQAAKKVSPCPAHSQATDCSLSSFSHQEFYNQTVCSSDNDF